MTNLPSSLARLTAPIQYHKLGLGRVNNNHLCITHQLRKGDALLQLIDLCLLLSHLPLEHGGPWRFSRPRSTQPRTRIRFFLIRPRLVFVLRTWRCRSAIVLHKRFLALAAGFSSEASVPAFRATASATNLARWGKWTRRFVRLQKTTSCNKLPHNVHPLPTRRRLLPKLKPTVLSRPPRTLFENHPAMLGA